MLFWGMMYLCLVAIGICLVWICMPQPDMVVLRLPKALAFPARRMTSLLPVKGLLSVLGLIGRIMPHGGAIRAALQNQLAYVRSRLSVEGFVGLQIVCASLGGLVAWELMSRFSFNQPLVLVVAVVLGFVAPGFWLSGQVRKRQRTIIRLLPEAIDLMTLCVGAGLDFLSALNKVVTIRSFRKEPLTEELSIVLQEIKLGKRRFESLKAMSKRVNLPEVSSFIRTLVQADRMGTPIAEVLGIHSEDVRFQRFQRAEREALKAPVKILLPLIFFIMPCVALIVGAPILLEFMKHGSGAGP